jgi:hypothetical protein
MGKHGVSGMYDDLRLPAPHQVPLFPKTFYLHRVRYPHGPVSIDPQNPTHTAPPGWKYEGAEDTTRSVKEIAFLGDNTGNYAYCFMFQGPSEIRASPLSALL